MKTSTPMPGTNLNTSRSRRMLVVTPGYAPLQTHGAELHTQRKVEWWRSRGHEVRVIAANPRPTGEMPFGVLEESHDCVNGIEVLRLKFAAPDATRPLKHTFDHPQLREPVEREIQTFKPDVVYQVSGYIFGVIPLELANQFAIPSVAFVTDYWHVCQRYTLLRPDQLCCTGPTHPADCAACRVSARGFASKLGPGVTRKVWQAASGLGRLEARLRAVDFLGVSEFVKREAAIENVLKGTSMVVANSRFLASWMRKLGVNEERLLVVRQGINPREFPPLRRPADEESIGARPLRVLFIGQVTRHKGIDTLVRAVRRLADDGYSITLQIHGPRTDGNQFLGSLDRYIDGKTITIGDPLSRRAVVEKLGSVDILAVPSHWYDNSPNVILEAFACGVPVITSNHGGTAEMVRDGIDGLLFEPGDVRSLEDAFLRILNESTSLSCLRKGIRRPHDVDEEMVLEELAISRLIPA